MALPATVVWEIRSTATALNINGGGFVSGSGGTDRTLQDAPQVIIDNSTITATIVDAGGVGVITFTGNTYTVLAGDVGNLLNIISTTGGTAPALKRYNIASVSAGLNGTWTLGEVCGSGVDTATITSARMGGALSSFNCMENDAGLAKIAGLVAGNTIYVYKGTYTSLGNRNWDYSSFDATTTATIQLIGYDTTRAADLTNNPTFANCPVLDGAATTSKGTLGDYWKIRNICFKSTGDVGAAGNYVAASVGNRFYNCQFRQLYAGAASRHCLGITAIGLTLVGCESQSLRGACVNGATNSAISAIGCYFHDSATGISTVVSHQKIIGCVFDTIGTSLTTAGAVYLGSGSTLVNNAFINCSIGLYFATASYGNVIANNIFADCYSAADVATTVELDNLWLNNCVYNCTTAWPPTNIPASIQFNGSTANPGFTTLVAKGADGATGGAGTDFSAASAPFANVTANANLTLCDYLILYEAGTGATLGVYGITAMASGSAITLDRTAGANKSGISYGVVTGGTATNLSVGTAMRALGYPTAALPGTSTTSYVDLGAAQRIGTAAGLGLTAGVLVDGNTIDGVVGSYPTTAATNAAHQAADVQNLIDHKNEMISANTQLALHYPGIEAGTGGGGGGGPVFHPGMDGGLVG